MAYTAPGCGPLNFGYHHDHCHRHHHHHCHDHDCSFARLWAAWGQRLDLPVHRRTQQVFAEWVNKGYLASVWGFLGGSDGLESACKQILSLGRKNPLEKETATHSSILAWRNSWTEEPGRLQSMGLQRVGHDWVTNTFTFFSVNLSFQIIPLKKNLYMFISF